MLNQNIFWRKNKKGKIKGRYGQRKSYYYFMTAFCSCSAQREIDFMTLNCNSMNQVPDTGLGALVNMRPT